MKKWLGIILCLCAGVGLAYWLFRSRPTAPAPGPDTAPAETAGDTTPARRPAVPNATAEPSSAVASPGTPTASAVPLALAPTTVSATPAGPAAIAPNSPSSAEPPAALPPATLLENMRHTVRQYGLTFGGNPVGTNPEITKALNGDNPKQIKFLGPDGNRINGKGELVDAWGTPYFFHQLSAMEMEIRSAGRDKIMWTDDDLVIK